MKVLEQAQNVNIEWINDKKISLKLEYELSTWEDIDRAEFQEELDKLIDNMFRITDFEQEDVQRPAVHADLEIKCFDITLQKTFTTDIQRFVKSLKEANLGISQAQLDDICKKSTKKTSGHSFINSAAPAKKWGDIAS